MAQVAARQQPLPHAPADDLDAAARRFLPPPGVHPNSAVFGAANLPKPLTWQRREHMVQRRSILGRIGQLLTRNAQLVVPSDAADTDAHAKTWALARKLEVLIFLNSASLLEYNNVDSLARRVQAMTASIVNKKIRRDIAPPPVQPPPVVLPVAPPQSFSEMMRMPLVQPDVVPVVPAAQGLQSTRRLVHVAPAPPPAVVLPPGGGKRSASDMLSASATAKRVRLQPALATTMASPLGHLLFQGMDELTTLVWSFVDGAQIMRCRAVSRAAFMLAPRLVTSLQLSCNAMLRALHTISAVSGACVLRECFHLKELEVVSLSSGMTFGKRSMRAMNCPQRFVVTHDDHEQIVLALSQQLRCHAFPQLTRLGLTCLFTNEEADGEADVLLNNLLTGCCPQLEELCLPGNSFGDYGAIKIAQMLRARVCPKLTRLDLRRNFISEEGIRSICHALADGCAPELVELCLGGNTITDSCFHHVLFAMESRKLPHLRFLGIEMNYLSATSMEMLGRTIGKMVCPLLSQISYSDNSVENAEAKRLIATAVYQERMFRQRQQQMRQQQAQQQSLLAAAPYPAQPPQPMSHVTMFPYIHEFPPATSLRGGAGMGMDIGMGPTASSVGFSGPAAAAGPDMAETPYSSADDDDDDDDDHYSSDGE